MENDLENIGGNSAHLPVRPGYARRGGMWGGGGSARLHCPADCIPPPYSQKGGHKNGQ